MNQCTPYRATLALRREEPNAALDAHLLTCFDCAKTAKRTASFDVAMRSTLLVAVPDDLTARLLALVPGLAHPFVRSRRWMRQRRALQIGGGVAALLAVGLLVYSLYLLGVALGVGDVLATVATWPGIVVDWLYRTIPSSRQVMAFLLAMRQPFQWAVLAALIWLAWDTTAARQGHSERSLAR